MLEIEEERFCKGLFGVHPASKQEDLGGIEKGCCVVHATLEFEGGIEKLEGDLFDLLGGKGETKEVGRSIGLVASRQKNTKMESGSEGSKTEACPHSLRSPAEANLEAKDDDGKSAIFRVCRVQRSNFLGSSHLSWSQLQGPQQVWDFSSSHGHHEGVILRSLRCSLFMAFIQIILLMEISPPTL